MVALGKVEHREPLSAVSLVQQRVDVWQGFDEGLGDGVQASKVVTNPLSPVWLSGPMAEEAQLRALEVTFRSSHVELFLTKDGEDLQDVPQVLLQCRAKAEDVVHVDDDRPMERTSSSMDI